MRHFKFEVHLIGSNARVESIESYEDNIGFYEENNFTFMPIPTENKFYDIRDRELKEMSEHQRIDYDTTVREAIDALVELPFLFFEDYHTRNERIPEDHLIITAADLNKRAAKEMMFSLLASLENKFAGLIEQEYSDSRPLFPEVSPKTIGRWKKAGLGDVQMHITEYMQLAEMQKIFAKSDELRSELGFESRNQFDKQMSGIIDLRNRVMHTSRTIIECRDDVEQLQERLERIEELI